MEANQLTIQSEAFKMIISKLDKIYAYVSNSVAAVDTKNLHRANEKWYSADEAASILNISRRTLLRIRSSGEISFFKIGKRIMYYVDEINNYEKKQPLNTNKEEELRVAIQPVIRKWFRKNKPKS